MGEWRPAQQPDGDKEEEFLPRQQVGNLAAVSGSGGSLARIPSLAQELPGAAGAAI